MTEYLRQSFPRSKIYSRFKSVGSDVPKCDVPKRETSIECDDIESGGHCACESRCADNGSGVWEAVFGDEDRASERTRSICHIAAGVSQT